MAGLTKFSEETLVIAAGNRPEDAGTVVRMIHNPLLNRFKIIRISPASVDRFNTEQTVYFTQTEGSVKKNDSQEVPIRED